MPRRYAAARQVQTPLLIKLTRDQPPVTIEDLALMLEIDLALGRRKDFLMRLHRALYNVARK